MSEKLIAQNRKATHDYEVLERHEAGIVLQGTEVKSLRDNVGISFKDSYADFKAGELWLVGVHIAPYGMGGYTNHEPERKRKLLMHRQEINKLRQRVEEKGLTMVPLKLYFKEGKVKVQVGLCRGKHSYDKRETLKARESQREVQRAMKDARTRSS
jgi:SsrA-binding protein